MKNILSFILLGASLLAGCEPREHFVKLAEEVQPKAVMIEVDTVVRQMQFSFNGGELSVEVATVPVTIRGAGVFISQYGHILSCAHLFNVGPNNAICIAEINGSTMPVTLVYKDDAEDLSLLKLDLSEYLIHPKFELPTYAELTRTPLRIGQEVLAVGNPFGLRFSVSHGIISAFRPDFDNGYAFTQDDAAINHGNSGGPLFNLDGELIGINTLIANGDGLAFAVSPETIRKFLNVFRGIK